MPEFLARIQAQVAAAWSALQPSQRVTVALFSLLALVLFGGIFYFATKAEFTTLGTFDLETAAEVKKSLTDDGMVEGKDFVIETAGTKATVRVNALKRNNSTLLLAEKGIVGDREKGFTIFDGFDLTTTDLEQKIKELEALKSELRRMIRSYKQVEDINISVPRIENGVFAGEDVPQTASVVLTLKAGEQLSNDQVKAVRNLIASGIPNLKPANITLTDQYARPLMPDEEGEEAVQSKQHLVEYQTGQEFENRIRKVLGPIVGDGKFTTAVHIEFNWDKVKQDIEEHSSPGFEQLRVSSQKTDESLHGEGVRPGGEPGTASNVPTAYNAVGNVGPVEYRRTEEVVNYLANKTVTERIQAPFIKRLTAAVAIDGMWVSKTDSQGASSRVYSARNPTELAALRDLVKSALGENPERRDVIEVREIQYDRTAQWDAEDKRKKDESFQRNVVYISILAIPLAALVFFGYLIWNQRRRMQDMDLARQRELDRQRLLASAQEGISGTITVEDQARMEGQRRAQSIARTKPAVVADLIRTWLSEDEAA